MISTVNALSIDVEDYFHASALGIPAESWDSQDQRATKNTLGLLEILSESGTKGTFFVLGWLAERYPQLVKEIAAEGHEVACHGYSHELIYNQSPEKFTAETRRAKDIIENITGQPVFGYRAASFSIVERSKWALRVIAELGFTYDSSIFPIYHDRYGIRGANPRLHRLDVGNGQELIELPPSVLTLGPFNIPVAGGGYFRLYPYRFTRWAMRRINRDGSPAIVYLHPWEIDTDQPRFNVSRLTRFRHYVNIDKVQSRLRRLVQDFQMQPMLAIAHAEAPVANASVTELEASAVHIGQDGPRP